MARKKEEPKPLFALKFDFYASLDNLLHQNIMLIQSVEQAIDLSPNMSEPIKNLLRERVEATRKALMTEGNS